VFIDRERKNYPLHLLCLVLKVSASGYDAWRKRLPKPPCLKRKRLAGLVGNCCFENRRRYGSRRIAKALGKAGISAGRRKLRAPMKEEGLKAI
jgi:putative transposase